jgi:hypothetical protein
MQPQIKHCDFISNLPIILSGSEPLMKTNGEMNDLGTYGLM